MGSVFERSGTDANAAKYISFSCEGRTLDIELSTAEAAAFVFKKFADLFQAYATAQIEKLKGEAVTIRVAAIVDGGASSKPAPAPAAGRGVGGARAGAAARLSASTSALPPYTPGAHRGVPPYLGGAPHPAALGSPAPHTPGAFQHARSSSYRL